MPEVIISGSEGRIEGRYHHSSNQNNPPVALVLHPHPLHGGTMHNKVVYNVHHCFVKNNFSVLRMNFRGVGKSQGKFNNGIGELTDAATALDWLQLHNPTATSIWVAGFSFGSWVAMQLFMRRPEIESFVTISPPVDRYDFSFLSSCPISGLIVQGDQDSVVSVDDVTNFANKIPKQKNIKIDYKIIENADHFYRIKMDELNDSIDKYIKDKLENFKPVKAKIDKRRRQTQPV
jgi:uncharacterized protein